MPQVMEGRRVLVTGVRNKWSIAWNTALSLHREGAQLAFSVFGEREAGGVAKLLKEIQLDAPIVQCDATDDAQVEAMFGEVSNAFGGQLHGLVHSIAFANRDDLSGEYVTTGKAGFTLAHESSVYSLVTLARAARPMMQAAGEGSIVTLSYLGAERAVPNYNVMGVAKASLEASVRYLAADLGRDSIRVNAVSAGPIKTLAASGIAGFDAMTKGLSERSPLKWTADGESAGQAGDAALFLLSPWSRGVTGEVLHVDGGYHIVGMA